MPILALDVGTSSVKAALLHVGETAPLDRIAHQEYRLDHPAPEAAEVPAERLWAAVAAAAREATRGFDRIDGIGISCMTPGLVLLDAGYRPAAPIWTHLDRRSRPAARQVWATIGPEFLESTGNRPLPGGISAISWRQQLHDNPYLCDLIHHYLHINSWLALHLTGERAFDPANASFTGLFETMGERRWSSRWCDYFQVNSDWLPPVLSGSATVGSVRASVASELGVPAGVPVKIGTADTSCAMLAARLKPGELLHEVGTTQVLAALVSQPKPGPRRLTRLLGVGEAFVHVTHNPVGGAALEWIHNLCFRDQSAVDFYG
jgi:xylulokinase